MATIKELFGAYNKGELPTQGGYIVSSFFDDSSTYTKYEVTSYNNVKDIFVNEEGITFQADGMKIFVLVEPANYAKKHIEPTYRDSFHSIPYRVKEVETFTSRRQDTIMVGKEPVMSFGSFTVLKSVGNNFSYVFYMGDDIEDSIEKFFADSIWKDARVPKGDAQNAAKTIRDKFAQIVIRS